jgi:glyoxylase-like metal-dependent hydrolase (beta-lactamase superfamily II)
VDGGLEDGQLLEVGEIALRVLHTPGHSLGSVCFQSGEMLFTGDTLFAGSVGRTDLPGGSWETLEQSLRRLLAEASPDTIVYPGHGAASTMGEEAASNPFLSDLV